MRLSRVFPVIVGAMLASGAAVPASASMIAAPITDAIAQLQEWNMISFNNFNGANEVEGRVFVGGDMIGGHQYNFRNTTPSANGTGAVTVLGNSSGSKIDYRGGDLVVGGNQSASTLEVNGSSNRAFIGGTETSSTHNNAVITTGLASSNPNFTSTLNAQKASLISSMTNLSNNLKALANTGGVLDTTYNKLLYTAGASFNVLNISVDDLRNLSQNYIDIVSPTGKTTVINVTCAAYAGNCGTVNRNFNSESSAKNILWNFYDATNLTLGNWQGSVLAVNADFVKDTSGAINGTIVGKNVSNYAEIHQYGFQGNLSSVPSSVITAPEPSTWAMMILGFGLVGATARRRTKRSLVVQLA